MFQLPYGSASNYDVCLVCELGILRECLQQDMWRMPGSRDWLSNACTSVERSIKVRVDYVSCWHGFASTIRDRCDNFRAFGTSDINEYCISVREFDFPSWHSEHA